MRTLVAMMLVGVLVLCTGCVRSLHPIYTDNDLVFEPSLVGQWAEKDSREIWAFSRENTNEYKFVYTDEKGKQGTFSAHLVRINGTLFLDFFPAGELKGNDFYNFHLVPIHTFTCVRQIEPTLQMAFPDADWLKKHIAAHPDAIRHEKLDDEIVLTAATKDLQAFWLAHLDTEGAFGDPSNMQRQKGRQGFDRELTGD